MKSQRHALEDIGDKKYGYGAGLMLATLDYHLKFDMSNLECILDDDPTKHNSEYQNINASIQDIKKGDELSYDYGFGYDKDYKDYVCKCMAKNCCGFIVREGSRWRIKNKNASKKH